MSKLRIHSMSEIFGDLLSKRPTRISHRVPPNFNPPTLISNLCQRNARWRRERKIGSGKSLKNLTSEKWSRDFDVYGLMIKWCT